MKPKWRYNIILSSRKGVVVREGKTAKDFDIFYNLAKEVESRGEYRGFSREYYGILCKTLGRSGVLKLFIAEYEGVPLGAIIVSFFGSVATYLHGATSNQKRDLMPMYALQWTAIKEAKRQGKTVYDFWGVAPDDNSAHPWAGITSSRGGFGGEKLDLAGTFDLPNDKNYIPSLMLTNRVRKFLKHA
jgi:lipid II:glycine glycyltransferase (peptidoglycan interpeptide bridge formation enzyme)